MAILNGHIMTARAILVYPEAYLLEGLLEEKRIGWMLPFFKRAKVWPLFSPML